MDVRGHWGRERRARESKGREVGESKAKCVWLAKYAEWWAGPWQWGWWLSMGEDQLSTKQSTGKKKTPGVE